jgi:hypothetical protein
MYFTGHKHENETKQPRKKQKSTKGRKKSRVAVFKLPVSILGSIWLLIG